MIGGVSVLLKQEGGLFLLENLNAEPDLRTLRANYWTAGGQPQFAEAHPEIHPHSLRHDGQHAPLPLLLQLQGMRVLPAVAQQAGGGDQSQPGEPHHSQADQSALQIERVGQAESSYIEEPEREGAGEECEWQEEEGAGALPGAAEEDWVEVAKQDCDVGFAKEEG